MRAKSEQLAPPQVAYHVFHDLDWMGAALRCFCRRHRPAGQGGSGACGLKPGHGAAHHRGGGVCLGHRAGAGQARRVASARPPHAASFSPLSGLATGLSWICYFRALQLGPASRVAPLDKLSVPLVMVFAWLLLGEKLTGPAVVGGLLITAGAVVMVLA